MCTGISTSAPSRIAPPSGACCRLYVPQTSLRFFFGARGIGAAHTGRAPERVAPAVLQRNDSLVCRAALVVAAVHGTIATAVERALRKLSVRAVHIGGARYDLARLGIPCDREFRVAVHDIGRVDIGYDLALVVLHVGIIAERVP